ncbi:hypothetical protein GGX14DRAFT_666680, partial [Mycena pura]
ECSFFQLQFSLRRKKAVSEVRLSDLDSYWWLIASVIFMTGNVRFGRQTPTSHAVAGVVLKPRETRVGDSCRHAHKMAAGPSGKHSFDLQPERIQQVDKQLEVYRLHFSDPKENADLDDTEARRESQITQVAYPNKKRQRESRKKPETWAWRGHRTEIVSTENQYSGGSRIQHCQVKSYEGSVMVFVGA